MRIRLEKVCAYMRRKIRSAAAAASAAALAMQPLHAALYANPPLRPPQNTGEPRIHPGLWEAGEVGRFTARSAEELKRLLELPGPAEILLEGDIEFRAPVSVKARDKLLRGAPGATLRNPNRGRRDSGILYFRPGSKNLTISNLTFMGAGARDVDGGDNLCLDGAENVVVEHCDFQDGVDGNFDIKNASDNIEVRWCRFRYLIPPLPGPGGSSDHRLSNLIGHSDGAHGDRGRLRVSFRFCRWENCAGRMPRVRFGKVALINCLFEPKPGAKTIQCGNESAIYVENCVFKGRQTPWADFSRDSVYAITERGSLFIGCKRPAETGSGAGYTPPPTEASLPASEVERALERAGPLPPQPGAPHGAAAPGGQSGRTHSFLY